MSDSSGDDLFGIMRRNKPRMMGNGANYMKPPARLGKFTIRRRKKKTQWDSSSDEGEPDDSVRAHGAPAASAHNPAPTPPAPSDPPQTVPSETVSGPASNPAPAVPVSKEQRAKERKEYNDYLKILRQLQDYQHQPPASAPLPQPKPKPPMPTRAPPPRPQGPAKVAAAGDETQHLSDVIRGFWIRDRLVEEGYVDKGIDNFTASEKASWQSRQDQLTREYDNLSTKPSPTAASLIGAKIVNILLNEGFPQDDGDFAKLSTKKREHWLNRRDELFAQFNAAPPNGPTPPHESDAARHYREYEERLAREYARRALVPPDAPPIPPYTPPPPPPNGPPPVPPPPNGPPPVPPPPNAPPAPGPPNAPPAPGPPNAPPPPSNHLDAIRNAKPLKKSAKPVAAKKEGVDGLLDEIKAGRQLKKAVVTAVAAAPDLMSAIKAKSGNLKKAAPRNEYNAERKQADTPPLLRDIQNRPQLRKTVPNARYVEPESESKKNANKALAARRKAVAVDDDGPDEVWGE